MKQKIFLRGPSVIAVFSPFLLLWAFSVVAEVAIQNDDAKLQLMVLQQKIGQPDSIESGESDLPSKSKAEILANVSDKISTYFLRNHPHVLVVDFPDLVSQARAFFRIILFIERDGAPKNRVLSVSESNAWLEKNRLAITDLTVGNNVRVADLARFFDMVHQQGLILSQEERLLFDWLARANFVKFKDWRRLEVLQANAVVISIPQVSHSADCSSCIVSNALRAVILEHELAHARYAVDDAYQEESNHFWKYRIDTEVKKRFTQFLQSRGYDANNPLLLANEAQAFLMHTPDEKMFSASDIGLSDGELASLRRLFIDGLVGAKTAW